MRKGMTSARAIGNSYETQAADYLSAHGYRIVDRNFTMRGGEIDIIAKQDGMYVFVEVRYRTDGDHGDPLETVTADKQRRICRTAQYYLLKRGAPAETCVRFDVIAVTRDGIRHITNAFDFYL